MDGILVLDKPHGWTSHDLVDYVRRRANLRRVGHAGTLDPMATGIVVILVGRATSLSDQFLNHDKSYEGILTLGLRTDTQDLEGRITGENSDAVSDDRVREAFSAFSGVMQQRAPRFSSTRVGGRKSYEMARKDVAFESPMKTVDIKSLVVREIRYPDVWFKAQVSKGTYIRALADEIGEKLGVGATLAALRRTASGPFTLRDAIPVSDIRAASPGDISARLLSGDILSRTQSRGEAV